jgi:hypothetical protein
MEEFKAATWATEADRKRDVRQRWKAEFKAAIKLWWHGVFWQAMHATRLARPYSVTMCYLRLYRKFPDGRCMWCGVIHDTLETGKGSS